MIMTTVISLYLSVFLAFTSGVLTFGKLSVEDLREDLYVFKSNRWPAKWSQAPSVGNGHLATVVNYKWMQMNGLYNGEKTKSHRAKIPCTSCVTLRNEKQTREPYSSEYRLDTRIGTFFEHQSNERLDVILRRFVHRTILPVSVLQIKIQRKSSNSIKERFARSSSPKSITSKRGSSNDFQAVYDDTLRLNVSRSMISDDVLLKKLALKSMGKRLYYGRTLEPEYSNLTGIQDFYLLHDVLPDFLVLKSFENDRTWTFLTSIHFSRRTVVKAYNRAYRFLEKDLLITSHEKGWLKLWNSGRVEISGNAEAGRAAVASLYNLLICIPAQFDSVVSYTILFTGLSPSGLSWGDENSYEGHTFWDAETWMFPPLLMLHQPLAPTLLSSRVRTMTTAAINAKIKGFKGLRYPWESSLTGLEVAPDEQCGNQEIHINGDISFAFLQYLQSTIIQQDKHSANVNPFPKVYASLLVGIGDFFLSRMEFNASKQLYDIKCVIPPDEYATCVTNSAFTNAVASIGLQAAFLASERLGFKNSSVYKDAAQKVYIPFDSNLDYHPEFDGYKIGSLVKQADVILLGFPLMISMQKSTRKKDLEIYENATAANGPAMSDSMYAVGWLEVGDKKKADLAFSKMFLHVDGEFQVWTEEKHGSGAPNFITGMGGYLQSLLFGYAGIRLKEDLLQINPTLLENSTSMAFYGIDYKQSSFDMVFHKNTMTLLLNELATSDNFDKLSVTFEVAGSGKRIQLQIKKPLTIKTALGYLRVERQPI